MNIPALPSRRTLFHLSWRYLRSHLWQTALMLIGIMLGVAVVIGVDIANESATQAFELSTTALTGRTTHTISAGSQGLDETIYTDLRRSGIKYPAAPVITAYVTSPQLGGVTLQVLGLDPFVEPPFRNYLVAEQGAQTEELTAFLTQPRGVLLSQEQAERFQLEIGSLIQVEYAGNTSSCPIVGLLDTEDALNQRALNETLLMDIASAQEVTGKTGLLDRVDLILPPESPEVVEEIQAQLPEGVQVLPVEARSGIVREMTRAFQINLTALSLLAMFVALFLIYNTMSFSVTQRRPLFGTLRSLGMTRREIFLMVLVEALGVGITGSVLGTGVGILMGRGTIGLVTQTINDLFFVTTVRDLPLPVISLIKGNLVGIIATMTTAIFPAREALSVPPRHALSRSNLESNARQIIPWVGLGGAVFSLIGVGVLAIPTDNLVISFGGTFLIIIGLAMLTPLVTTWLMTRVSRLTNRWGAVARMAPREVVNALSRTSVAVAALMISVAVTIGVSLMISSFRMTVVTWLDQILHGDVYVSVPGATVSQPNYPIEPEAVSILESWESVARVDLLQTALVDSPYGPIQLSGTDNPDIELDQVYRSTAVPLEDVGSMLEEGAILISEPLANRLSLPSENAELPLYTDRGLVRFPVAGVYSDYSSTQGNATLTLDVYQQYWDDQEVTAAALLLEPNADVESTTQALQTRLADVQRLLIRPNQALRRETMAVFDRTFAITGTLRVMTTVVAFVGVLSAMMSLQLEKQRQIGILRAVGLTGRQLWELVFLETGLMGMVAGLLAMPTGYVLALILISIINRRSFGWTLLMQLDPAPFLQALLIAVGASLLAGILPARRILRRNISDAIRFE
jgi:putative ABC transport system permease protein